MNRKAILHSVFNDGEVMIQAPRLATASASISTSPEGVTVKIASVDPRARTALFKGLGKCSRVVASSRSSDPVDLATGADLSCSSDDIKGNYGDISTFVRPQKKATTVAVKTEIAAEHLAQGPSIKLSTSSDLISDESLQTKVVARTKNFRMDNEMKNFDPAEWRSGRALSKSGSTIKSSGVVNCGTDIAAPLPFKAAASHVQLSPVLKSNTLNRNKSVSDDDSDDEDTCRLDISVCDTQKISIKRSSSSNKRSTADTEDEITFKKKPTPPSQDKISVINLFSNSNDIIVCNDIKRNTDVYGLAQKDDENNPKKCKKVSFASHFDSDKKTLSSNQEYLRLRIKTVEKVNNNHDNANNDNYNNNEGVVTVVLNNVRYTRLNVLGKGGSSCVYRVLSQSDSQLYAYKRVEVKGCLEDSEAMFDSYINEIDLLRRLKGSSPYIIELVDAEINREELYIAIIMEAGDIDLSKVLSQKQTQIQIQPSSVFHQNSNINQNLNQNNLYQNPSRTTSTSSNNNNNNNISCSAGITRPANAPTSTSENKAALNPFFIRLMWLEMLEAVDHIHANRIVHGDLKPANFVFVKGHLKLIDFGIAKAFSNDTTNIYRQSQIGTVNYMAPEAIAPYSMDSGSDSRPEDREGEEGDRDRGEGGGGDDHEGMSMRLGRASDIWSLGCILYQMIYGRPPFAALTTIQKLRAIPDEKYVIQYPHGSDMSVDWDAVGTIQACLHRDPRKRALIRGDNGLLSMPFLSIDAMQCSRNRNENRNKHIRKNRDEDDGIDNSNHEKQHDKDKDNDNCISVSKEKVKNAMVLAMKYLKGRMKEGSFEHEEQFLLNKVWDQLRGKDEGKEFIIDMKKNDSLEIHGIEHHCSKRIEDNDQEDNDDVDDYDKSGEADAVTIKLPPRPIIVPALTSPHHISRPCPRPPPITQTSFPLAMSSRNQDLLKNNNENSCITSNSKQIIGASKDTVAVRSAFNSNGNPVKSDTLTGIASVTSQSTRLALVDAAAAISRRRAATLAVNVNVHVDKDKECNIHTTSSSHLQQQPPQPQQHHQQQPLRQPLRTLPFHQEQSTTPHNVADFRIHSPDKQDPRSVLEKRIGAMRKFLSDEVPADDTGTSDFMDGISFF